MKKYAFGVDIGGTTCKIGFFETTGKMIDKWEIKTNTENNGNLFSLMLQKQSIISWHRKPSARMTCRELESVFRDR